MSKSPDPNEQAYANASPFQPKQQPPLLESAVPVSHELPAYLGAVAGVLLGCLGTCVHGPPL